MPRSTRWVGVARRTTASPGQLSCINYGKSRARAALQRASAALREGEARVDFLDDLYLVLPDPACARDAMGLVTGCVEAHTRIAANRGKNGQDLHFHLRGRACAAPSG